MSLSLNIIGCGKVGRVLGTLLERSGRVASVSIVNRTPESGNTAATYFVSARVESSIESLPEANVWMIATPDAAVQHVVRTLGQSPQVMTGSVVFHVSGALDSAILEPLRDKGALLGSIHPVRSIAHPELAAGMFEGTACAVEGDRDAVAILRPLISAIGGRPFDISRDAKLLCHAGHVFASNYVVTVLDVARRLYRAAGIPDEVVDSFLPPIVRGTLENVIALGSTAALTGPVVRGEAQLVGQQLDAIMALDPEIAETYHSLAMRALEIAEQRSDVRPDLLRVLRSALEARRDEPSRE